MFVRVSVPTTEPTGATDSIRRIDASLSDVDAVIEVNPEGKVSYLLILTLLLNINWGLGGNGHLSRCI